MTSRFLELLLAAILGKGREEDNSEQARLLCTYLGLILGGTCMSTLNYCVNVATFKLVLHIVSSVLCT